MALALDSILSAITPFRSSTAYASSGFGYVHDFCPLQTPIRLYLAKVQEWGTLDSTRVRRKQDTREGGEQHFRTCNCASLLIAQAHKRPTDRPTV